MGVIPTIIAKERIVAMNDLLEIKENVKQEMFNKGIIKTCSCGQKFYRNPYYSDDSMIYGCLEKVFASVYSDKALYRNAIKEILDETFIGDSCDNCGDKW